MEIEIRSRINNLDNLLEEIEKLNILKKNEERQIDTYFKHINDITRKMVIRVREIMGKQSILTFKGASPVESDDTMWADFDTPIEKPEVLKSLLLSNGYELVCIIDKHRQSFEHNGFEINIDNIKELGSFIEIEKQGESEERKQAELEIVSLLKKLGINENDIIKKGYVPLMLEKINTKY